MKLAARASAAAAANSKHREVRRKAAAESGAGDTRRGREPQDVSGAAATRGTSPGPPNTCLLWDAFLAQHPPMRSLTPSSVEELVLCPRC